jgi:hypothetical protein
MDGATVTSIPAKPVHQAMLKYLRLKVVLRVLKSFNAVVRLLIASINRLMLVSTTKSPIKTEVRLNRKGDRSICLPCPVLKKDWKV